MYNRYVSHSAPEWVEESERRSDPQREQATENSGMLNTVLESAGSLFRRLKGDGEGLFSGIPLLEKLDSGDLLLLLVLIFLFRESEDEEWLIILALVLMMGL